MVQDARHDRVVTVRDTLLEWWNQNERQEDSSAKRNPSVTPDKKKKGLHFCKPLILLVPMTGIELMTFAL
jgi:hypothetical protein